MWTLPCLVVVAHQQLKLLQRLFNTGAFHRYASSLCVHAGQQAGGLEGVRANPPFGPQKFYISHKNNIKLDFVFLSTLKVELISWQVDLVRVDLVTIYLDSRSCDTESEVYSLMQMQLRLCYGLLVLRLPQISYASSSADLQNRERFMTHFQMYPPDDKIAPAIATLLHYYGWRRISTITEKQDTYLQVNQGDQ